MPHGENELETVTACIDNKVNIDAVYLDLAKAFDKVSHQRLVYYQNCRHTELMI